LNCAPARLDQFSFQHLLATRQIPIHYDHYALSADLLLVDETAARQIAATLRLPFSGLPGLLLSAKQQQHIGDFKPLLDDLRNQAGFWIAESLYQQVLHMAGE